MSTIWEEEFRDQPVEYDAKEGWKDVESGGTPLNEPNRRARTAPQRPAEQAPQTLTPDDEEFLEAVLNDEYDEDVDNEQVLADANLRLEQGNLYKIIMNHDLFGGVEADERAVNNVQREIRRFARERMEIMLGMRVEKQATQVVSSPFNSMEVEALKLLCAKMTGGQSKNLPEAPTAPVAPRKVTLNPISSTGKKTTSVAAPAAKKPLQAKAQTPVARAPTPPPVPANADDYKPIGKQVHEMTEKELLAHNAEAAKRQRPRAKATGAIPMMSPEQEEFMYQQRINSMPVAGQNAISLVMAAMNNKK